MPAILPPATLGILGGGQLGRMFTIAAKTMGYRVIVLDPDPIAPAADFADEHLCAAFDDHTALAHLATHCAAVTTEFENVSAAAMQTLAQHTRVSPAGESVAITQDRRLEKQWIQKAGLQTAPYHVIETEADLSLASTELFPAILKTARMGYDGKGQITVNTAADLASAWDNLQKQACVLEKRLDLACEISAIVTRVSQAQINVFPVSENQHKNGILDISIVPARIATKQQTLAQQMAMQLAQAMNYIGVLSVEFFVLGDGRLVVNEMAPRPHNSGHYTLDACATDQFQQQVRAMCGLLPGDTRLLSPVVMTNLLGDLWPDATTPPNWQVLMEAPNAKLHLYGKASARAGRKMGHYTVCATDVEAAKEQAQAIFDTLS